MAYFTFSRNDGSLGGSPDTHLLMARMEVDPENGAKAITALVFGNRADLADVIETHPDFAGVTDAEFCAAFDALAAGEALPDEGPDLDDPDLSWVDFLPEIGTGIINRAVDVIASRRRAAELRLEIARIEAEADRAQANLIARIKADWSDSEIATAYRTATTQKEAA